MEEVEHPPLGIAVWNFDRSRELKRTSVFLKTNKWRGLRAKSDKKFYLIGKRIC
jgi:hypothetical protein